MKLLLVNCKPALSEKIEKGCQDPVCEIFRLPPDADVERTLAHSDCDFIIVELDGALPPWLGKWEEYRKNGARSALVLMGSPKEEVLQAALALKADAFLPLPFSSGLFRLTLQNLVQMVRQEEKRESLEHELEHTRSRMLRLEQQQKDASIEQELTYQELSLAYSRLQDLTRKRTSFLSLVTHELKTPITVIKGYHRILLDERLGQLQPQQREILTESEHNCNRLNRIVNSLLDLSRMDTGRFELVCQENNFAENLALVLKQLEENFKRKKLEVVTQVDPAIPRFRYDRERINQVLMHLLENSLKYTPAGGKIVVEAKPCFWERRNLRGKKGGNPKRRKPSNAAQLEGSAYNALLVGIEDTGVGIPPEQQQQVFEEFTQAPGQSASRSGMGLGLSISRRIVEAHRGKIWVESQVREGSKFSFFLPLNFGEDLQA